MIDERDKERAKGYLFLVRLYRDAVPEHIMLGLLYVESRFDPWAVRYEPHYRWLYKPDEFAKRHAVSKATEVTLQKTSFGLGQVMGAVAREYGFDQPYLTALCEPATNLHYVGRHLNKWLARYGTIEKALAAYNGGPGAVRESGLVNERYVNEVMSAAEELKGL